MKTNMEAHIRGRMNYLLAIVALTKGTTHENFLERFDDAARIHTDPREKKELKYRRKLIATFQRRQMKLFLSIITADKRNPLTIFELIRASHSALKQGVGITWTGVYEAIAAATGHKLMYSPEIMLHDKEAEELSNIPEYPTEAACKKAWPDKAITKHLKGTW